MPVRNRGLSSALWVCLALLALLPRLANLGTFSLWLDEIIETNQAGGSFLDMLAALRADAVHPPLEGVIAWAGLHAGLGETGRRLIPIAFGVGTILIVARFTVRRFGRIEGLLVGAAMALAPFHVHYSQELRPYSLALFCAALSLSAGDRLLDSIDARRLLGFLDHQPERLAVIDEQTLSWGRGEPYRRIADLPRCWIPMGAIQPDIEGLGPRLWGHLLLQLQKTGTWPWLSARLQRFVRPQPAHIFKVPPGC